MAHWDSIAEHLNQKRDHPGGVALFLDFDGTLVPIAKRPSLVRVASVTRNALQRLAENRRAKVTIISGRRRSELLKFIRVQKIKFLGLYGWDDAEKLSLSAAARIALRRVHVRLKTQLSAFPGVWIEDKRGSLSVHLLEAAPSVRRLVLNELRMLINPLQTELKLFENLRDAEIVPRSIRGKGLAVSSILRRPAYRKLIPFYLGDDLSDEPAFTAVRRGYSVHVGRAPATHANFFLRSPGEVTLFLKQLEASL
ncbi:MAG: trehalose-phosphatase [Candidatus Acidiferrum sp.]